jgi:hypothetical protein
MRNWTNGSHENSLFETKGNGRNGKQRLNICCCAGRKLLYFGQYSERDSGFLKRGRGRPGEVRVRSRAGHFVRGATPFRASARLGNTGRDR